MVQRCGRMRSHCREKVHKGGKLRSLREILTGLVSLSQKNDKMKSKGWSFGDPEPHLIAVAEAEASALASVEDAEVIMRPMVVLKKAQQSTGGAKVRRATSAGQKVKRRKHLAHVHGSPEYSVETPVEQSKDAATAVQR
ncbi:unnamed protein product [Ixodes pacificus]